MVYVFYVTFQFNLLLMITLRYLTDLLCSNFWPFIWIFTASALFVLGDRSNIVCTPCPISAGGRVEPPTQFQKDGV